MSGQTKHATARRLLIFTSAGGILADRRHLTGAGVGDQAKIVKIYPSRDGACTVPTGKT
jgi:hypothetical protein